MISLINMPFGAITHPSLALGLIKAELGEGRCKARVLDLSVGFAKEIGFGRYVRLSQSVMQVGEWLFAGEAWDDPPDAGIETFLAENAVAAEAFPSASKLAWLTETRRRTVPAFLARCLANILENGVPRVVGFSCGSLQSLPALALGRRIRQHAPGVKLVCGGPAFHGEMGEELMEKVPWLDAVSTGEADDVIVPLFRALCQGRPPSGLTGILYRDGRGRVRSGGPARPVHEKKLDALPDPDFDDFFSAVKKYGLLADRGWQRRAVVPFESSRGCWWGEKRQCAFCGLNGEHMSHRARSAAGVHRTLCGHAGRYPVKNFYATDNNLGLAAFGDLLPMLAERPPGGNGTLFYSVKPPLSRKQVQALAEAGVTTIGPGIESLSTRLLALMRKGVNVIGNVHLLKCCRQYGIHPRWNNLVGIPGESDEDYRRMASLIPLLHHLPPPASGGRIQLHRFSPYFRTPGKWADNIRPRPFYASLYPAGRVDLFRVAHWFDCDWKHLAEETARKAAVTRITAWRSAWYEGDGIPGLVTRRRQDGGLDLEDTRSGATRIIPMNPREAAVYLCLDDPVRLARCALRVRQRTGGRESEKEIGETLDAFVSEGLALMENGVYLGLALPGPPSAPAEPEDEKNEERSFHEVAAPDFHAPPP